MRQLGSKLSAGGLSAALILLWWPLFFPTDTVGSWLGRGVAWTLSFELLLLALSPFEAALWGTGRGERLVRRMSAARGALIEHEVPRVRIGRRAGVASGALAIPLALIAVGLATNVPAHRGSAKVTHVTRVVRVVRPVQVKREVRVKTVSNPVPVEVAVRPAAPAAATSRSPAQRPKSTPRHSAAEPRRTPTAHAAPPESTTPAAEPPTQTGDQSPAPAATAEPPT